MVKNNVPTRDTNNNQDGIDDFDDDDDDWAAGQNAAAKPVNPALRQQ